ncbi:MAG: dihydrodipicolinate synthase family protein [Planctomycetes bacterium]|nr:dihydrodipicolinate synthase family protein [Planctomycetota bacterium]
MAVDVRGVIPALLTAFDADGKVDLETIGRHVDWLIERGIGGLFPCGTTGEGMSLTVEEREEIVAFVGREFGARLPMIAHVGHPSIEAACRLARHAAAHGARAVCAVGPIYYRTTSAGLRRYYEALAAATDLPLLGYYIPAITGFATTAAEFEREFFPIPHFAGLKFTSPDHFLLRGIIDRGAGRLAVYSGHDEMALSGLMCGSCGLIGSTYNMFPEIWVRIYEAFARGDLNEANRWMTPAVRVVEALGPFQTIPAAKAALRLRGFDPGDTRPPLPRVDDALVAAVGRAIEGLELEA